MKDALGDRMKKYEKVTNYQIPPRTYTVIRFDGRGFSKYTKKMDKPFDLNFSNAMDVAAKAICKEFNAKLAYTQSDEISIMITDIENIESELPFGGKVQKLCSVGATCVANAFNGYMLHSLLEGATSVETAQLRLASFKFAEFDARVFVIPDFREVSNYFVWRQQDATRNSVSMAASAIVDGKKVISHNEQQNKNTNELQEMLFQRGINWNDYPEKFKRGVVIAKEDYIKKVNFEAPASPEEDWTEVTRSRWATQETPVFTQDKEFLHNYIPIIK